MISLTAKAIYEELSSELLALNQTWRYVHDMTSDLFRADTLNRASAPYFGTVLNAFPVMADVAGGLTPEPIQSLHKIRAQSKQLVEYRNKEIAHRDRVTPSGRSGSATLQPGQNARTDHSVEPLDEQL
jgi:hypothetical protein